MLSSASLQSPLFDRLTGKGRPGLQHPTASAFDRDAWIKAVDEEARTERDAELAQAALYFHQQVADLRSGPITNALKGLGPREVLQLAVASANRVCLLTFERLKKKLDEKERAAGLHAVMPLVRTGGGRLQPELTPDDVVTATIDTLPHWFAQAQQAGEASPEGVDLREAAFQAEGALSLERAFRNLWHGVLWEGGRLHRGADGWEVHVGDVAHSTRWAAWEARDQSLASASGFLGIADMRRGELRKGGEAVLSRVPVSIRRDGRAVRVRLGAPGIVSRIAQNSEMSLLTGSYLREFLDEPLTDGPSKVTPRLLMSAWFVIDDLGRLIAADIGRTEIFSAADARRLSAPLPYATLLVAVRDSLGVTEDFAELLLSWLTADCSDIGTAFRDGLWHRPIIDLGENGQRHLLLGVLRVGSPLRRMERWLMASGHGGDLTTRAYGLVYEARARDRLRDAVTRNELFSSAAGSTEAIKREGEGEEIDSVLRFGRTVLVCEIKCLVIPSEALERYNHIAKLESAARQATRKAAWLQANPAALEAAIGKSPHPHDEHCFVPLVVLNHGIGMGLEIEGCIVTDERFLALFLGDGSYTGSGLIGPGGKVVRQSIELYRTERQAEEKLREILAAPPALTKFLPAVQWRFDVLPAREGAMKVQTYSVDQSLMIPDKARHLAERLFGVSA